jgi:hypothetical protein
MFFMKSTYLILAFLLFSFCGFAQIDPYKDEKGVVNLHQTPFTAFDNMNGGGVANTPTSATSFTLAGYSYITYIQTYHWNYGRGTINPGTIKLVAADGTVYGPWVATGAAGQGGVANAFWTVNPTGLFPPGTYTIIDSDNATWSQNAQSLNKGFAKVGGKK